MSFKEKAQAITEDIDDLLLPFLEATSKEEEERRLGRLLDEHINPVIRRILRYKMQWYFNPHEESYRNLDSSEAYHDIQLHLLKRLHDLKHGPADKSLSDLRSYVATTARNACDEYLRRKFPQRRKLKDRIRYCLTSRPDLSLWKEENQGWLSGLAEWQRMGPPSPPLFGVQSRSELLETLTARLQDRAVQRLELHELLKAIFHAIGSPLELDQLTAAVARLLGIEDAPVTSFDAGVNPLSERMASPQATPEAHFEHHQLLEELWREIRRLPRSQRVALLCNLKSPQGVNIVTLFPATRVASFEQLAEALEIPPEEFESLWSRLPLDDLSIAEYLGITRQQVINLRRSARDRLLRRRKALES